MWYNVYICVQSPPPNKLCTHTIADASFTAPSTWDCAAIPENTHSKVTGSRSMAWIWIDKDRWFMMVCFLLGRLSTKTHESHPHQVSLRNTAIRNNHVASALLLQCCCRTFQTLGFLSSGGFGLSNSPMFSRCLWLPLAASFSSRAASFLQ